MSLKLISKEGKEFHIKPDSTRLSSYLKQHSKNVSEIKLSLFKAEVVEKLAKYLDHYAKRRISKLPEVLETNNLKNVLEEWDYNFLESCTFSVAFHLINVGNFLTLTHLHDLACIKIAAFMKDKPSEEIENVFTIECQLTPEEASRLGVSQD